MHFPELLCDKRGGAIEVSLLDDADNHGCLLGRHLSWTRSATVAVDETFDSLLAYGSAPAEDRAHGDCGLLRNFSRRHATGLELLYQMMTFNFFN